jgi:hypothetical protein
MTEPMEIVPSPRAGEIVVSESKIVYAADRKLVDRVVKRVWSEKPISESNFQDAVVKVLAELTPQFVLRGMQLALQDLPGPGDVAISAAQHHYCLQRLKPRRRDDGSYELVLPDDPIEIPRAEDLE